jgi:alpha-mannosidase
MKKVHIVSHSHWDREWYFNLEDSNILLGENLTYLMGVLEENKDYTSYSFDAQASIIDEYLNIYPENKERLKKLITDKRIFVGPWYTQADSLLINKESLIRNLQYGIDICEDFGHSMSVGYLPDIFGQNQYLPSIFKGFEIDNAVFQRGVYTDQLKGNLNFKWRSPDGIEVRANNIYLGYGPGKFLDSTDEYIEEKLLPMLKKLETLNTDCNDLLLPAGGDQVLIREHFPRVIKELNQKNFGYEFILSDYEQFMKSAWKNKFENKIEGELRGCEKSRIHRTIGSQRYDIKKANSRIENKILNTLEPLGIIGMDLGIEYPQRWLDICWKLLFDVHAHDSIGGCNSDSTNDGVITRLDKVEKIVDGLINMLKKKITVGISSGLGYKNILTVFNTKLTEEKESIKSILFTKKNNPIIKTRDGKIVETEIINSEYISGGKRVVVTADGDREEEIPGYYRSEILIKGMIIPSLGYDTFIVEEEEKEVENRIVESNYIENQFYKIELKENKLILENKITKEKIDDFLTFESCGDGGDSYDFSPVLEDDIQIFNNFELVSTVKKNNFEKIELISKLDKVRKLEITTIIELSVEDKTIKIRHSIFNREEDHRLRAVIESSLNNLEYSYSDSGFSLIKHPVVEKRMKNWKEDKYAEAPVPIYNLENLVLLKDEKNNLQFFGEGIKEYEVLNSKLAVTLFRAVGVLGNDNLTWRPGRASGINNKIVYTPDAQMKNQLEFEYEIVMDLNCKTKEIYQNMEKFIKKSISYQLQVLNTFEERLERFEVPMPKDKFAAKLSLLNIETKDVFISVTKKSHIGDFIIIRVFNPGNEGEVIKFKQDVTEVNLKENEISKGAEFTVESKGYKTFKIKT